MRQAYLIAASVFIPGWHFDARTVREAVAVAYHSAMIRNRWRIARPWLAGVLAVIGLFLF